jgi:hypothetical protein
MSCGTLSLVYSKDVASDNVVVLKHHPYIKYSSDLKWTDTRINKIVLGLRQINHQDMLTATKILYRIPQMEEDSQRQNYLEDDTYLLQNRRKMTFISSKKEGGRHLSPSQYRRGRKTLISFRNLEEEDILYPLLSGQRW